MSKTNNKATAVSDAIKKARDALAACDSEIERLHEQRRAIAGAPVPRADAKAAASERINAAAAPGRKRLAAEAERFAQGDGSGFDPRELFVRWVHAQDSWKPDTELLAAVTAREVEQQIHAAIDADPRYDADNVMPAAERANRLQKLDREIEAAEQRRDDLLAEFEAAGLQVGGDTVASASAGGDRGMAALYEDHERRRQQTNAELERAGVTNRERPHVIDASRRDARISVKD